MLNLTPTFHDYIMNKKALLLICFPHLKYEAFVPIINRYYVKWNKIGTHEAIYQEVAM